MKVQTGVSSKDVSTLKELAELEKHQDAAKANEQNLKTEAETKEEQNQEEVQKSLVVDAIHSAKAKWDQCFLKPDNCCVVKAVRKITT